MGQPFALDFGAVMAMGAALGVDQHLLADVLPTVERAVIVSLDGDDSVKGDEHG